MPFIIVMGILLFLLMEHALVFWLLFVPLAILFVAYLCGWFKTGGLPLSGLGMALLILVIMVIVVMVVSIP